MIVIVTANVIVIVTVIVLVIVWHCKTRNGQSDAKTISDPTWVDRGETTRPEMGSQIKMTRPEMSSQIK